MVKTAAPRGRFGVHGNNLYRNGDSLQNYETKQSEFFKQCVHHEEARLAKWGPNEIPASLNKGNTAIHVHKLDLSEVKHIPGPSGAAHARRSVY